MERTYKLKGFGIRLGQIRRDRGMTQVELGEAAGLSQRMIAYYERDHSQPPGAIVAQLARALGVSADEMLGLQPEKARPVARRPRMLKRLQRVQELPPADQRAVFKMIDGLLATQRDSQNEGRQPDK